MPRPMPCVIMAGPANRRIQVATETRHLYTTGERIGRAIMWVVITIVILAFIGWILHSTAARKIISTQWVPIV